MSRRGYVYYHVAQDLLPRIVVSVRESCMFFIVVTIELIYHNQTLEGTVLLPHLTCAYLHRVDNVIWEVVVYGDWREEVQNVGRHVIGRGFEPTGWLKLLAYNLKYSIKERHH